ncbi:MAG: CocE/NonD family hydrolase C-terminal non-catalytic domain-containing protein [Actinomycetota bacterium]
MSPRPPSAGELADPPSEARQPSSGGSGISHGYADSHTFKDESSWDELEPGKAYRWKLDLMPTAVLVKKGHTIANG